MKEEITQNQEKINVINYNIVFEIQMGKKKED